MKRDFPLRSLPEVDLQSSIDVGGEFAVTNSRTPKVGSRYLNELRIPELQALVYSFYVLYAKAMGTGIVYFHIGNSIIINPVDVICVQGHSWCPLPAHLELFTKV